MQNGGCSSLSTSTAGGRLQSVTDPRDSSQMRGRRLDLGAKVYHHLTVSAAHKRTVCGREPRLIC